MTYRAKDHFHVPRKHKKKLRPSEQDILEHHEELELEQKFRHSRPKKRSNEAMNEANT